VRIVIKKKNLCKLIVRSCVLGTPPRNQSCDPRITKRRAPTKLAQLPALIRELMYALLDSLGIQRPAAGQCRKSAQLQKVDADVTPPSVRCCPLGGKALSICSRHPALLSYTARDASSSASAR